MKFKGVLFFGVILFFVPVIVCLEAENIKEFGLSKNLRAKESNVVIDKNLPLKKTTKSEKKLIPSQKTKKKSLPALAKGWRPKSIEDAVKHMLEFFIGPIKKIPADGTTFKIKEFCFDKVIEYFALTWEAFLMSQDFEKKYMRNWCMKNVEGAYIEGQTGRPQILIKGSTTILGVNDVAVTIFLEPKPIPVSIDPEYIANPLGIIIAFDFPASFTTALDQIDSVFKPIDREIILTTKQVKPAARRVDSLYKSNVCIMVSNWDHSWGMSAGPGKKSFGKGEKLEYGPDGFQTTKQGITITGIFEFGGKIRKWLDANTPGLFKRQRARFNARFSLDALAKGFPSGLKEVSLTLSETIKPAIDLVPLMEKGKDAAGGKPLYTQMDPSVKNIFDSRPKANKKTKAKKKKTAPRFKLAVSSLSLSLGYTFLTAEDLAKSEDIAQKGYFVEISIGSQIWTSTMDYKKPGLDFLGIGKMWLGSPAGAAWSLSGSVAQNKPINFLDLATLHNGIAEVMFIDEFPVGMGMGGDMKIKKNKLRLYGKFDPDSIEDSVFIAKFDTKNRPTICLPDFVTGIIFPPLGAGLVAARLLKSPKYAWYDVVCLEDIDVYIVPYIGQIGQLNFDQGYLISGNMNLLGQQARVALGLDWKGFIGFGWLNPIVYRAGDAILLSVTEAEDLSKGARINIGEEFNLSGKINILGVVTDSLELEKNAFVFKDSRYWGDIKSDTEFKLPINGDPAEYSVDFTNVLAQPFADLVTGVLTDREKELDRQEAQAKKNCEAAKVSKNCLQTACQAVATKVCDEAKYVTKKVKLPCKEACDYYCNENSWIPECNWACMQGCRGYKKISKKVRSGCKKYKEDKKQICDFSKYGCQTWNQTVDASCKLYESSVDERKGLLAWMKKWVVQTYLKQAFFKTKIGSDSQTNSPMLKDAKSGNVPELTLVMILGGKEYTITIKDFNIKASPPFGPKARKQLHDFINTVIPPSSSFIV